MHLQQRWPPKILWFSKLQAASWKSCEYSRDFLRLSRRLWFLFSFHPRKAWEIVELFGVFSFAALFFSGRTSQTQTTAASRETWEILGGHGTGVKHVLPFKQLLFGRLVVWSHREWNLKVLDMEFTSAMEKKQWLFGLNMGDHITIAIWGGV